MTLRSNQQWSEVSPRSLTGELLSDCIQPLRRSVSRVWIGVACSVVYGRVPASSQCQRTTMWSHFNTRPCSPNTCLPPSIESSQGSCHDELGRNGACLLSPLPWMGWRSQVRRGCFVPTITEPQPTTQRRLYGFSGIILRRYLSSNQWENSPSTSGDFTLLLSCKTLHGLSSRP
jgi:hypothetical protein